MCKFLCGCTSSMICLLRNLYIWERSPFIWYPIYFEPPCFLSIILWWLQICFMSAYLNFICIFAHSCVCWWSLSSCLPWWVCWFLLARCSHKLLAFSIGFLFQLVSLSLQTSLIFKDLCILVGPILCLNLWKLVSPYGSTTSLVQVLCFALDFTPLHLLSVLDDFGGVRIPYLCTPQ